MNMMPDTEGLELLIELIELMAEKLGEKFTGETMEEVLQFIGENGIELLAVGSTLGNAFARYSPFTRVGETSPIKIVNDPIREELKPFLNSKEATNTEKLARITYHEQLRRSLPLDAKEYESPHTIKSAVKLTGLFHRTSNRRSVILKSVFFTLKELENTIDGLLYFSLDVPITQKNGMHRYTRIRKYKGENKIRLYDISDGHFYQMQPMFPRLAVQQSDDVVTFKEPDIEIRKAAMQRARDKHRTDLTIFQPKINQLMFLYLKDYSNQKIRMMMGNKDQSYIDDLRKKASKVAYSAFDCGFKENRMIARYWWEMGLYFPEN